MFPFISIFPTIIHVFKANNKNTRKRCEICSMLTVTTLVNVTTPENIRQKSSFLIFSGVIERRCCGVLIFKFELFFIISIVEFEEVIVCWLSQFCAENTTKYWKSLKHMRT